MAKVRFDGVMKRYGDQTVIRHLNLEIKDREFLVLVGPSGCGKSTALRMIAGLEDITAGDLHIGDRIVNVVPPRDRDIAMVFQNYALYPHMTVRENMAFALKLRKQSQQQIDDQVEQAARRLEITHLLDRKPKALSGGQRQRVALGRAVVRNPAVFLMDEPLSNLDAKLRASMRAEIKKLHQQLQTTFVYVTHDQTEAMTMGDRIAVFHGGELQQLDTPANVYHRPVNTFVATFIGSPQMNMILAEARQEGQGWILESPHLTLHLPLETLNRTGPTLVGIRPEHFLLQDLTTGVYAGRVELVEMLGSDAYLHLEGVGQPVLVRMPPEQLPAVGQVVRIGVDGARVHLFDPVSQQRLNHTMTHG